jgi:hypothetical protein
LAALTTKINLLAKLYHVQPHEHNMLDHSEKTDGKIYNHSIITGVIASQLKVNKGRPVSKYIFIILLADILLASMNQNIFDCMCWYLI